ncbi:MAG: 30S ribosomal protein S6 [Candidatus Nomurabacteria bacterium]|nr:30S ribosomal protein S6 [Candidatus Nomurabacteria bacterium]
MPKKESKEEKDLQNMEENNDSVSRIYELGHLLIPTLAEDEVPAVFGNLKDLISGLGGVILADEMPKMMTLAYQMVKVTQNVRSKFDTAYFGWVKFEMNANKVLELKNKLDLDPNYLRFLVLKTVKENTIATKKFAYKEGSTVKRKPYSAKKEGEVEGEVAPINKEEIDKEIDALITV